jgi:hypothetical protein
MGGVVYFIDVSQSVEHDHPQAVEFLKKDSENITQFFLKHGCTVLQLRELFEYVTFEAESEESQQHLDDEMVARFNHDIAFHQSNFHNLSCISGSESMPARNPLRLTTCRTMPILWCPLCQPRSIRFVVFLCGIF